MSPTAQSRSPARMCPPTHTWNSPSCSRRSGPRAGPSAWTACRPRTHTRHRPAPRRHPPRRARPRRACAPRARRRVRAPAPPRHSQGSSPRHSTSSTVAAEPAERPGGRAVAAHAVHPGARRGRCRAQVDAREARGVWVRGQPGPGHQLTQGRWRRPRCRRPRSWGCRRRSRPASAPRSPPPAHAGRVRTARAGRAPPVRPAPPSRPARGRRPRPGAGRPLSESGRRGTAAPPGRTGAPASARRRSPPRPRRSAPACRRRAPCPTCVPPRWSTAPRHGPRGRP